MSALFQVDDQFSPAIQAYAFDRGLRGKELQETARIVMRKILFHAIQNIPKGNKEKFLKYVEQKVYSSKVTLTKLKENPSKASVARAAKVERWRGTLAAWIVFKLNIFGARAMKPERAFAAVGRWVAQKSFAFNLHKAGFLKARSALRVPSGEKLPRLRNVPGDFQERVTEEIVDLFAENWASAQSRGSLGIAGLAPDAISKAIPAAEAEITERLFQKFTMAAKRNGFEVSAAA